VHLPEQQLVQYVEGEEKEAALKESNHVNKLLAYFKLNTNDENARVLQDM